MNRGDSLNGKRGATTKPELRLLLLTLVLPVYFSAAVASNYVGAFHAPRPHQVKVAVVGPPAATTPVADALSTRPQGGFAVARLASTARAARLVGERQLAGAYIPDARPPTAIVASAASGSLSTFIEATFRQLAARQDRPLAVDDVRPLPPNNISGSSNFFFIVICTFGGFLTVVALGAVAPALPERHRIAVASAGAVLSSVVAYLIAGLGYGALTGSVGTVLAMVGTGALYAFAVAAVTRLMQLGLGAAGAVVASLAFIFFNFPSSGGSVAAQLLPGFWRFINQFWIGAAGLDANRSILYFDGAGVGIDILKIAAWVAAWAVLLAIPIYRRSTRVLSAEREDTPALGGRGSALSGLVTPRRPGS